MNIRQRMFSENNIGKYLAYTVIEVILIVIGILIALSIDNWNESLIEQKKIDKLIVRINEQIIQNLQRSQQIINHTEEQFDGMISLMSVISSPAVEPDEKLMDSLIVTFLYDYHIRLDLNTLSEAMSNGEIALIKDDSLRVWLYKLTAMVNHIEMRENIANTDLNNFLVPYLYKNVNFRNISSSFDDDYKRRIGYSRFSHSDYSKILMDREFENLLDSRINYVIQMLDHYRDLKLHLDEIMELMEDQ